MSTAYLAGVTSVFGGVNADQTNVLQQLSQSGARFAVMTGDTAYPGGGEKEYGTAAEASQFARAFDKEDSDDVGRRAPFLGMFPLRIWRKLRNGG